MAFSQCFNFITASFYQTKSNFENKPILSMKTKSGFVVVSGLDVWSDELVIYHFIFNHIGGKKVKSGGLENNTDLNSIFCLVKSSQTIFIFTWILSDYIMHHDSPKNFEKLYFFENMTVGFLLRRRNLL